MTQKKILTFLICIIMAVSMLPLWVSADIGPKPSVSVTIEGAAGETYFATLLSERKSTGPASAYDGSYARYTADDEEYDIWEKFVAYEDCDGYYFLQEFWDCTGKDSFRWGYYPPDPFKILLYFPEQDVFVSTGIYERYAFDSYYQVSLEDFEVVAVEKTYDYSLEVVNLAVRIVITILVELLVALLFGLRSKRQLALLTGMNVSTQIILNVLLNMINYNKGQYAFVFYYVLLELLVLTIEAVVYGVVLRREKYGTISKSRAICYAFAANGISFTVGLWIAQHLPGIF
ncbi:MAG: hypothetical protein E7286_00195 [Lachnospiraceae bacterium]|nr:hypothetical protein [Lachnospiraceae bacterium]